MVTFRKDIKLAISKQGWLFRNYSLFVGGEIYKESDKAALPELWDVVVNQYQNRRSTLYIQKISRLNDALA